MSYRKYLMTDDVPPSELYKTVKIDTDSDTISRQSAIDEIKEIYEWHDNVTKERIIEHFKQLPPAQPEPSQVTKDIARIVENEQDMRVIAQPEIIYCKDCKKQNKDYHMSPYKDTVCPLTAWRGTAQGHEYDYQFCCFAERREMTDADEPAQPERIVRCKDCKHWIPYDWMFSEVWRSKNMADYPEDEIGCNWCDMAMKANDFCSQAEMREVTE